MKKTSYDKKGGGLSVTREEKRTLENLLPLINRISNQDGLKDLVIETWVKLWRQSPYLDITEAPNFPSETAPDEALVRHTNAVASMVLATAKALQRSYGTELNCDFLLAGAVLHDVDKLLFLQRKGNVVEFTELGRKAVHGQYGASVAGEVGLPPQVVNIIASHSAVFPSANPATVEAVLVAFCDLAVFQSFRLMTGLEAWRKS